MFFAQAESERALHPELAPQIDNLCMGCHGVMGQRQLEHDSGKELFTHQMGFATPRCLCEGRQTRLSRIAC